MYLLTCLLLLLFLYVYWFNGFGLMFEIITINSGYTGNVTKNKCKRSKHFNTDFIKKGFQRLTLFYNVLCNTGPINI